MGKTLPSGHGGVCRAVGSRTVVVFDSAGWNGFMA